MPSALTPKVPLTVVANQVIVGMATTVQVGAWEVLYYIFTIANPCRVTVRAHTELLGSVTVPSLLGNILPHGTWVLHRPKEFICARVVRWGQRFIRPYPRRLKSLTVCRFLHRVLFCICLRS